MNDLVSGVVFNKYHTVSLQVVIFIKAHAWRHLITPISPTFVTSKIILVPRRSDVASIGLTRTHTNWMLRKPPTFGAFGVSGVQSTALTLFGRFWERVVFVKDIRYTH